MSKGRITAPEGAEAVISVVNSQFLAQYWDKDKLVHKFINPAALRSAVNALPVDSGWLPRGVVRQGEGRSGRWIVTFNPPAVRRIVVIMDTGRRLLEVPMPALLFIGVKHTYYTAALKVKEFDPEAELFHTPLPNINKHGAICFGSDREREVSGAAVGRAWETFWTSAFNDHHMGDGGIDSNAKSARHPADIREQLRELHDRRARRYPLGDLLPMGLTVEQSVERVCVGRS